MGQVGDDQPKFRGWEDTPGCNIDLVGDDVLLFAGGQQNTTNFYLSRLNLPQSYEVIARHIFDAIASVYAPVAGVGTSPPYYVVAAGMTDEKKFFKVTSTLGVSWIRKPHQAGTNVWAPGVYLSPMKRMGRGHRAGSYIGLGNDYNRGPIPPEDHERIGREVLELFEIIRTDFDRGPLPRRLPEK